MGYVHDDIDHTTTASIGSCSLLARACLNPATRPLMAIASSTDASSELLLRQYFGFHEDNGKIVDTKKVICIGCANGPFLLWVYNKFPE